MRGIIFVVALLVAIPASAHVTISPKSGDANSTQEYTVRVPTEKDVPTTSVRMVFPEGFDVLRFRPAAGWKYEVERDPMGRIAAVTWSGNTIARDEYEQFYFMARAKNPGTFKLEAYQTYNGNDVVGWVEPEGGKRPAPQVTIKAAAPRSESTGASADPFASQSTSSASTSTPAQASATPGMGTWLGALSVIVALAALVMSQRAARQARTAR